MDESGNFSIQIICAALALCNLELISYHSSDLRAVAARQNNCSQQAFICHCRDHWFTLYNTGSKWFNVDSLLTGPKEIENDGIHRSRFATKELINEYTGIYVVAKKVEVDEDAITTECECQLSDTVTDVEIFPNTIEITIDSKFKKRTSALGKKTKEAQKI